MYNHQDNITTEDFVYRIIYVPRFKYVFSEKQIVENGYTWCLVMGE